MRVCAGLGTEAAKGEETPRSAVAGAGDGSGTYSEATGGANAYSWPGCPAYSGWYSEAA